MRFDPLRTVHRESGHLRGKEILGQLIRQEKESTKIKFLGPEAARWGGGLPREGVVAENFVPSLESLSSLGFEERNLGCPGNFAGVSRTPGGFQKVCAKKVRARFSFPSLGPMYVDRWSLVRISSMPSGQKHAINLAKL